MFEQDKSLGTPASSAIHQRHFNFNSKSNMGVNWWSWQAILKSEEILRMPLENTAPECHYFRAGFLSIKVKKQLLKYLKSVFQLLGIAEVQCIYYPHQQSTGSGNIHSLQEFGSFNYNGNLHHFLCKIRLQLLPILVEEIMVLVSLLLRRYVFLLLTVIQCCF